MIKNLLNCDEEAENARRADAFDTASFSLFAETADAPAATVADGSPAAAPSADAWTEAPENYDREPAIVITHFKPPSTAESVRRSGLAWSAGVVFFGSVVFTLILGWIADLLLGTSPWGIVAGIILGSAIAFVNFFRITGQIFRQ
jgi:hypothetical protein